MLLGCVSTPPAKSVEGRAGIDAGKAVDIHNLVHVAESDLAGRFEHPTATADVAEEADIAAVEIVLGAEAIQVLKAGPGRNSAPHDINLVLDLDPLLHAEPAITANEEHALIALAGQRGSIVSAARRADWIELELVDVDATVEIAQTAARPDEIRKTPRAQPIAPAAARASAAAAESTSAERD